LTDVGVLEGPGLGSEDEDLGGEVGTEAILDEVRGLDGLGLVRELRSRREHSR
jgi:hypothetical protein